MNIEDLREDVKVAFLSSGPAGKRVAKAIFAALDVIEALEDAPPPTEELARGRRATRRRDQNVDRQLAAFFAILDPSRAKPAPLPEGGIYWGVWWDVGFRPLNGWVSGPAHEWGYPPGYKYDRSPVTRGPAMRLGKAGAEFLARSWNEDPTIHGSFEAKALP